MDWKYVRDVVVHLASALYSLLNGFPKKENEQ
jgi:hypothetical protein